MSHLAPFVFLSASFSPNDPPLPPQATEVPKPQVAEEKPKLPQIVVTGTLENSGVPKVPLGYPASRDVFGPEEIARTGARDLNDLMQRLPAISSRPYNGGDASAPSFSMRGMPDDGLTEYVQVMIDGVPSSPMPYGWTAYSFFPLITEQVYAIDLIRGGQSVRYSPNNVAGVLNLITPPIPQGESYVLRTQFGDYDYSSTMFSAGGGDADFGYLFSLGQRQGDGYRANGEFEYSSADSKLRWNLSDDDWLALRLSYVENQHQAPGGLTQAEFNADRFGNARPENKFEGFRAHTDVVRHIGDDRNYVEWFGWLSQTRRELERGEPLFGGATTTLRNTADDAYSAAAGVRGAFEASAFGMEHDVYWGVRASEEWLPNRLTYTKDVTTGAQAKVGDIEYQLSSLSAHVDDTLRPIENLTVTAGVRVEWVPTMDGEDHVSGEQENQDFFTVLPGLGAAYEISDSLAAFANFQRSFRAPQVWGLDTSLANPSQNLDFESGQSFEVGLRADAECGVSGSVALWQVDFEDVGFFDTNGLYGNVGDIHADGVDLVLGYDFAGLAQVLDGFSVQGSVTWQDSELRKASNPVFIGNETPYAWETKAAWNLQYATENDWRFVLGGSYVGESFSDEANTVAENANGNLGLNESRTVWDAQVSHGFRLGQRAAGRLSIGGTNIFDEDWSVHSRGGFFGGGKVAGPPRQLYFGIQLGV